MLKFLKWILLIALLLTIALVYSFDSLKSNFYIPVFILFSVLGWISTFWIKRLVFFQITWLIELVFYFIYELVVASAIVVHEVMTKKHHMEAGVVAVPLDTKTDLERTIFSSLVSLTPGTMSLDFSVDKSHLFIHAMYVPNGDAAALIAELKSGFEVRVIKIFGNDNSIKA